MTPRPRPTDADAQQTDATIEHLLEVVAANRDRRCAELLEEARAEGRSLIAQAHQRAGARMRRHISALRDQYRVRVTAAIARNQTRLRQQEQQADSAALDAAWPLLRDALGAMWRAPASRQLWIESAITAAALQLRRGDWCVEHPRDLDPGELHASLRGTADGRSGDTQLVAHGDLDAGLRIRAGGTVFDATTQGLTQQKLAIESRLLAQLRRDLAGHERSSGERGDADDA